MWWPEVSGGLNAKRGAALQVPRCTGTHTHSCWPRGTSDSSPAYSSYSSSTIFHSPCTSFLCQGLPGNRPNRPPVSFPKTSLSLSLSLGQYMESMGVEGFGAGILGATQCKGYFGCYTHTNSYLYPVTSHFLHVHLLSTISSISHNLTHNFCAVYVYLIFHTREAPKREYNWDHTGGRRGPGIRGTLVRTPGIPVEHWPDNLGWEHIHTTRA